MATDSPRVWTSPITLSQPSHPPPYHDPQHYNTPDSGAVNYTPQHMSTETLPRSQLNGEPLYPPGNGPLPPGIPLQGPASHPEGPRDYTYTQTPLQIQFPASSASTDTPNTSKMDAETGERQTSEPGIFYGHAPNAAELYSRATEMQSSPSSPHPDASQGGAGANHYPSSSGVPRLPPIMQVEKQQVTTSATQLASASRRRNEAHFVCPVPGCGSTFTRRFNLRG